jgi:glucosyl-3-phosphoglycerate synthase
VGLGVRAHRHQALRDLGGMATQIIAAALARSGSAVQLPNSSSFGDDHDNSGSYAVLRQYLRGLEPVEHVVPTIERPPAEGYL